MNVTKHAVSVILLTQMLLAYRKKMNVPAIELARPFSALCFFFSCNKK